MNIFNSTEFNNFMLLTGDLFAEDWTQGNLYSIQPITNFLGTISCWVISAVGFGIVIFSIIKNALSGLYVVNPKLFDKVDEVQRAIGMGDYAQEGALGTAMGKVPKIGSILQSLLALIPNVKALTDFDGVDTANIDKKQYFMKSIPWLVAQIFIGMIIFMGYPAKIAEWCGNAGTRVIDICLNNVDPIETIENLSQKMTIAKFATDDSKDPYDKFVNEASVSAWRDVVGHLDDMEKSYRQSCAYEIESVIQNGFRNVNQLSQSEGWDVKVVTAYSTTEPTASAGYSSLGNNLWSNASTVGQGSSVTYKFWFRITGNVNTGSAKVDQDNHTDYEVVTVTITPKALKTTGSSSGVYVATLGNVGPDQSGKKACAAISGIQYSSTKNNGCITGQASSCTVECYDGAGNVTESFNGKIVGSGSFTLVYESNNKDDVQAKANAMNNASKITCRFAITNGFKYYATNGQAECTINIEGFTLERNNTPGVILSNMPADSTPLTGDALISAFNGSVSGN